MSNSNTIDIPLDEFVRYNYLTYGKFVNIHRMIPGSDGLKKVYRRALMGAHEVARGKTVPTLAVLGATQKYHPFSDKSTLDTISNMVRLNMLTGDGQFGAISYPENLQAAAPRYTECGLSKDQDEFFFGLSKYAPETEGESMMEPEYLITPIPIQLTTGGLNWGFGISGRTPAFTYESLVEAYLNDNPQLLKSSFGYEIDYVNSDLQQLWETGEGRIQLMSQVSRLNEDKILLKTSGEIFTPALGMFDKYIKQGQLMVENASSVGIELILSRVPRARMINMDEVYSTALSVSKMKRYYNILTVFEDRIRTIGIKEWIDITWTRFQSAFEQRKSEAIAKLKYDASVLPLIPVVGKMIIEDVPEDKILSQLKSQGLTKEILDTIKQKSISTLRKSNWESEVNAINSKIPLVESQNYLTTITSFSGNVLTV